MNSDVTLVPWQQFKIQLRKTWSALTDKDLAAICQGHDDLVRVVQLRCECRQDEAAQPLTIVVEDCQIDHARTELARLPRANERRTPVILRKSRRARRTMLNDGLFENIVMRSS